MKETKGGNDNNYSRSEQQDRELRQLLIGSLIGVGLTSGLLGFAIGQSAGQRSQESIMPHATQEAVDKPHSDKTVFLARNVDGSEADNVVCEVTGKGIAPRNTVKIHNFARNEVFTCTIPQIGDQVAK